MDRGITLCTHPIQRSPGVRLAWGEDWLPSQRALKPGASLGLFLLPRLAYPQAGGDLPRGFAQASGCLRLAQRLNPFPMTRVYPRLPELQVPAVLPVWQYMTALLPARHSVPSPLPAVHWPAPTLRALKRMRRGGSYVGRGLGTAVTTFISYFSFCKNWFAMSRDITPRIHSIQRTPGERLPWRRDRLPALPRRRLVS